MAADHHIIHQLVLDIEVPNRAMADTVPDLVLHQLYHDLLPKLKKFLDELDLKEHLLIEKLVLDIGKMNASEIPDFADKLLAALRTAVSRSVDEVQEKAHEERFYAESDKAFKTFTYFLEYGSLPWYTLPTEAWLKDEQEWIALIEQSVSESGKMEELIRLITSSENALSRLLDQFSSALYFRIIELIQNIPAGRLKIALEKAYVLFRKQSKKQEIVQRTNFDIDRTVFERIFLVHLVINRFTADDSRIVSAITDFAVEIKEKPSLATLIKQVKKAGEKNFKAEKIGNKNGDEPPEKEGLFVQHAGLVLLHPFLQYFFQDFGLTTGADFTDEPARQLGVHLLHYLASGITDAAEYDLAFEKFLCEWPAEKPIERFIQIPQRMLDEADHLLKVAIGHWSALKNTSPDGLREGFLIRNGKLLLNEEPVVLLVEKNTIDILMSSLPWGLGVIKLPWMRNPFYVDWQ